MRTLFVTALFVAACHTPPSEPPTSSVDAAPLAPITVSNSAPPPSAPASEPSTSAALPSSNPSELVPDPITHPCVVTSVQFDIAFRDGDKSCQRDSDCECIPQRVGDKFACSGVTSKKTMGKLRELEKKFGEMKCTASAKCAKSVCQPHCASGQCQ